MSEHELRPEHRHLRELLRDADPASEERLSPEAVAAMRRRMLEEAEAEAEDDGRVLGLPALVDIPGVRRIAGIIGVAEIPWIRLAAAATITVVVGLLLRVDIGRWLPTGPPSTPSRAVSTPSDTGRAAADHAVPPDGTEEGQQPSAAHGEDPAVAAIPEVESAQDPSTAETPETAPLDSAPGSTGTVAEAVPPPPSPSGGESGAAPADPVDRRRKPRDVRFTTPGGTEIIWTLDPDFELPVRPRNPGRGEPR